MRVVSGDDEATHGVAECAGRAKHMIYVARDGTGEVGRGDAFLSFYPGPQYMLIHARGIALALAPAARLGWPGSTHDGR